MTNIDLSELRIVPIKDLLLHEQADETRLLPLSASIKQEGYLRNPPLV